MTCFITNVCIGHLCNHETLNLFNVLHIAFCHSWIVNSSSPSRLLVGITHFYFKRNLLLKLKKLTSGLLKNLEQNKWLLNLENFTSHCLKNPEIWLVLLIGPLLIRTYCVYSTSKLQNVCKSPDEHCFDITLLFEGLFFDSQVFLGGCYMKYEWGFHLNWSTRNMVL